MGPFLTVTREDSVPHDYSNNSGHETFVSLQEEEFHFFVPNLHINFHRRLRLEQPQEFQDFFRDLKLRFIKIGVEILAVFKVCFANV